MYTRWGRTTCPSTAGTQLLYAERAAGSHHNERGGGANRICLPEQPQYSTYTAGTQFGRALLYGVEYKTAGTNDNGPLRSIFTRVCTTQYTQECMMTSIIVFSMMSSCALDYDTSTGA